MLRRKLKLQGLVAVLWTAALAFSCAEGQFGSSGSLAPSAKKKQKSDKEESAQSSANEEEALGDSIELDDPEDDKSDVPAMVAGSFLTCKEDLTLPAAGDKTGVGCTVLSFKGTKLAIPSSTTRAWALLDQLNLPSLATFTDLDDASSYHVTTQVPRANVGSYKVRGTFKRTGASNVELVTEIEAANRAPALSPVVSSVGSSTPSVAKPEVQTFGEFADFQLGDDKFSAELNKGCVDRLQALDLSGAAMSMSIKVKSPKATVAISLKEMCGISGSHPFYVFKSGNKDIAKANLGKGTTKAELPGLELGTGDYSLEIVSPWTSAAKSDRDDFVIGKVTVTFVGDVEIGLPKAQIRSD